MKKNFKGEKICYKIVINFLYIKVKPIITQMKLKSMMKNEAFKCPPIYKETYKIVFSNNLQKSPYP